jgi:hypothetical protein
MEILGISVIVLVLGLLGYVWKLRKMITDLVPGEYDDQVVDTIEGLAEQLGVDVDELAAKSRGKLKAQLKDKL